MTQNLAYLPAVSPPDTGSYTEKHYYVFDFSGTSPAEAKETDNYSIYGVLYNWEAATTACPDGWHLPSDKEWKILEKQLGMSEDKADMTGKRISGSVGKKLKSATGWNNNGNGDNSSGFYALPGGFRDFNHTFKDIGINIGLWTSTEFGSSQAMLRAIFYNAEGVFRISFDKQAGLSVRCVKD